MMGNEWAGEKVARGLLKVSAWCLISLSILVSYMVVRRYLFRAPEPYSYEISAILVLSASILSVAGIQSYDRHLKVDFLVAKISEKRRKFLGYVVAPAIALFYVMLMFYKSLQATLDSARIGEVSQSVWREPLWPVRGIVVVGVGILCVVLVGQLSNGIKDLIRRRSD